MPVPERHREGSRPHPRPIIASLPLTRPPPQQLENPDEGYQSSVQFLLNLVHVSTYPSVLVTALDSPVVVEKLLEHTLNGLVRGPL